jgi:hypothetical protein
MLSATFVLFEFVCIALERTPTCFIADEDLGSESGGQADAGANNILKNLRREHDATDNQTALASGLHALDAHFAARHSELPFTYDLVTRQFTSRDPEFIRFVSNASGRRSSGGSYAKQFETAACERLSKKVTGILHNVGYPRSVQRTAPQFKRYLMKLGFDNRVILGNERDGGLDILWFPPFGAHPVAPVISLQCKNGLFSRSVAREASARTAETLLCHRILRGNGVHLSAVLFNDYIEPERLPNKPITYVPLGLSDLASVKQTTNVQI